MKVCQLCAIDFTLNKFIIPLVDGMQDEGWSVCSVCSDGEFVSELRHQGYTFVERFDANSVLYITRAMDYFDLSRQFKGGLVEAFKNQKTKFLVISFSSDWLYTTKENKDTVIALNASGADVSFAEIKTDKGHDSFLVNEPEFLKTLKGFIDSMHIKFRNEKRV